MAAAEPKVTDRRLTIVELLDWMVADGLVEAGAAEQVKKERRYYRGSQHPLEVIADQKLKGAKAPGKVLSLEALTEWLAKRVGMVFLRFGSDHHGVTLVGGLKEASTGSELHHFAFEVATLDEVFRARKHLRELGAEITFEGRRRAGVQIAVEFKDPDGHWLEIYWGLDQVGADGQVRPASEWRWLHTLEEAVAHAPPGQVPALADPSLLEPKR